MYDRVIKGGTLVTAGGSFQTDLAIQGEKIKALGRNLEGKIDVDAHGLLVLPGGIDPHVHLEMPTATTRTSEDWSSGTMAAAFGGTTTVIDFVEPAKGQTLLDAFEQRRSEAHDSASVDYGLHMTLTQADENTLSQIPQAAAAGLTSFKLYTTYPGFMLSDHELLQALNGIQKAGGLALVHCENDAIIQQRTAELLASRHTHPRYHAMSRPAEAEVEAIHRVITLASLTRTPLYVVHISTAGGAAAVRQARAERQVVYGETCPQYLLLDASRMAVEDHRAAASLICSPPLRTPDDSAGLWRGLSDGTLQTIGTDHCAFNLLEQKDMGLDCFLNVPGGLPSIEARLSLIYSAGVCTGRLDLADWVAACCTNPAHIFGLYPRKGTLMPGADADIVLFDPQKSITLTKSFLHEQVDYTPYEGIKVTGWPVATFLRGQPLVFEEKLVHPGKSGRYLPRPVKHNFQPR